MGTDTSDTLPGATAKDESIPAPAMAPKVRNVAMPRWNQTGVASSTQEDEDQPPALTASTPARTLTQRSDFEVFVEGSVGHPLRVYGRELFEEVPSTFAPLDRIPVPANYAIGPGDELLIRAWGKIDLDVRLTVDRNGQISLPKVGVVSVAGLRYEQLEGYLRQAVGVLYKDFELNVALGRLRSIQVLVLGNARRPGSYTLSSLSTLVDALFASGGPSATGSMRHIQLRRGGRIVTEFDVYDLQQKGDKSCDSQLLPGDEIYIPPVGPQIAIVGNVNEPGIFELKGSTSIAAALRGAGGLTNMAATAHAILERIENHMLRRVDEFVLDGSGSEKLLQDGDVLRVFPISPQFDNAVTIRGNVASPGRFPWRTGMRVTDLIPSRQFLITRDHWDEQNHLADEQHTELMADISESSAEVNWDYAVIERLDERDLSTRLIAFNLGRAIDQPASPDNQLLQVGDVLTIFSRKDLALPVEKHAAFVRISGEVNAPGVYRIRPGESLRDAVEQAGGLTPHSYLYASQLTRPSTRQIQEEQLKQSIARLQKELISQFAEASNSAGNMTGVQSANERAADQQVQHGLQESMIAELSKVRPTGRVVLDIEPDARALADIPDFTLEDEDSFYVPQRLGTVQVVGEVYNENAFRYQARKPLSAYLNDSGGATRMADVKRIFLIRADGTVVSRQSRGNHWPASFDKLVVMAGDAIIVPPKLKTPGALMQQLPVITQMLSQSAMTGAVLSLVH